MTSQRITRGQGANPMDRRIYRKIANNIELDPEHGIKEEIEAWKILCSEFQKVSISRNDIFYSSKAAFSRKLLIYKSKIQMLKDRKCHNFTWPSGSSLTPSSAIKTIRSHFRSSVLPLALFLGQPSSISPASYEHAWAVIFWKEDNIYRVLAKDSITKNQGASIPGFAKIIAKKIKSPFIFLKCATDEDNNSENDCVMLAFKFICDLMDGFWEPSPSNLRGLLQYDVICQKYMKY